jgi:hypothetical protein
VTAVTAEETDDPECVLQFGDVSVEVEPVDALDFEGDVLPKDFGQGAR